MRHFILVEALEGSHASIAVDQISYVVNSRDRSYKSKIVLISGTEVYSTELPKEVHLKIKNAQEW